MLRLLRIPQRVGSVTLPTAFVVLIFGFSASAQQTSAASANVSATVLDATGAAWVRADVVLIDTRTLQEQRGSADEKGVVSFRSVKPGNYLVIAAPHPPIDCADSGVKQFTAKPGQSLDIRLTVQVNHCAVVE